MSRAALTLYEMTGYRPYLEKAIEWVDTLDKHFWRSDIGGYALTPDDADASLVRVRTVLDGATPAANGTMVEVHARLLGITGNQHHAERYSVIIQSFADDARRQPAAAATYLNGFDFLLRAFEIVLIGDRNSPVTAAFRDVFRRANLMNRIVLHVASGDELPAGHPAAGKGAVDGKVTVYVCTGQTCSLPVTDPMQLETQLKMRVVQGQAPAAPAS
jgi:uncharacterized protein YyaL (SSP411 family)